MWIGAPAKYHSEARTLCGVSWRRRHAERAAEPRRGVREEVDVRHKCRALNGWCFFECYIASQAAGKGEGVLRCKPPNLRALRKFLQKLSKVTNYGIM